MVKILSLTLIFSISLTAMAKKYELPKFPAEEAIKLARIYIDEKNIKTNTYILTKVSFKNIYNEYQSSYWLLRWEKHPMTKGGWFDIKVYNTREILLNRGK